MTLDDECFAIDSCDSTVSDFMLEVLSKDPLELSLEKGNDLEEALETQELVAQLETWSKQKKELRIEEINKGNITSLRPSMEELLELELKRLCSYLEYAFFAKIQGFRLLSQ